MDLINLLQWGLTIVAGSGGAFLSAELVKLVPSLPVKNGPKDQQRRLALRFTAGLGATVLTLVGSWLAGDVIDPSSFQGVIEMVFEAALAWLGADVAYSFSKPKEG